MGHEGVYERRNDDDVYKDGGGALRHHERLKEVRKERGWSIMKKQVFQEVVHSTYVLKIGSKILEWWGDNCSIGGIHYV